MIAAITSCTNTSNPSVLVAAGLVARKARALGPDAQAVGQDQPGAGQPGRHRLSRRERASAKISNAIGFNLVGYGCTTCIGNSGPLPEPISKAINDNDLVAASRALGQPQFRRPRVARLPRQLPRLAASGGRLCAEGHGPRRHGQRADRQRRNGEEVFLKDIWPTNDEVRGLIDAHVHSRHVPHALCRRLSRRRPLAGDRGHRRRRPTAGRPASTYIQNPPYFTGMTMTADAAERHRSGARRWRCSAIRSPPTTSRRPARSSRTARPAVSDRAPGSRGRVQQLWRAPRQSRSDDARHLRQHPHPQPHARQSRAA